MFSKNFLFEDDQHFHSNNSAITEDVFMNGLNLVTESDHEIYDLLSEGVNTSSIEDILGKIFNKYYENMYSVYNLAAKSINKSFKKYQMIQRYKNEILRYSNDIDIENLLSNIIPGLKTTFLFYNYTNLWEDIPPRSLNNKIIEIFLDLYEKIDRICLKADTMNTAEGFKNILADVQTPNIERGVSVYRGMILNSNTSIFEEQYDEELFRYFHNGVVESEGPVVPRKYFASIYDTYTIGRKRFNMESEKLERYGKSINLTRDKVIDTCNNIISVASADPDNIYILNAILKQYCAFTLDICDACLLAYSYRMEAFRNAMPDYAKILYSIIYEVLDTKGDNQ